MKKFDDGGSNYGDVTPDNRAYGRNATNVLCTCSHARLDHTYDPKDYDRYACLWCTCPKFEAVMLGRDRVTYPQRIVKPIIRYRENTDPTPPYGDP